MKTSSTLALSALFLNSLVAAVPTNKHNHHAHLHKKRELVVVTEEVVKTEYSTTTIWVDPTPAAAAVAEVSSSAGGLFYEQHHSHPSEPAYTPPIVKTPSSAYVAPSSVYTPPPAPAYTPPASSSVYTPPVVPSSVYTPPPAPSSVYTPPASSSVYVAPTPAYTPPASSSAAAAPSATAASYGGGEKFTGDITYYNPAGGYGACGFTIADSDHVVAIAHDTWDSKGTMSNGNPWCGQKITILNKVTGKTWPATIGDKCMGTDALPCTGGNLDLAQGFFDEAFPSVNGRGHSDVFEWWET
ncbi:uncharacterized protein BDZ99DRAFT_463363 [Mytilinidion resinicola]|uniref:Uncharacterized protein n=1 Tax=Mytilinidion resinicola TaxID=574789 RepID=A0A6A6YL23_9PEZI|nr:uncharacterized protein BDZ99DRAFT_463363 [Mytilinidion resinicola]KAF2809576.1 hypothetical protein BDZ99DRAFT_463363 [Mytilinidion resinicola]